MHEGTAVTEEIEGCNQGQDDGRIDKIISDSRNGRIRYSRDGQYGLQGGKNDSQVRQYQSQFPGTVVLIEKDIHEIMFLRFLAKKHNIIENIMKLRIKNHLAYESHIEDKGISQAEQRADNIAVLTPPGYEQARQCHQNQRNNEDIGIEIHAPPKTETKTFTQGLPLPCQRGIRLMDYNENSPENGT